MTNIFKELQDFDVQSREILEGYENDYFKLDYFEKQGNRNLSDSTTIINFQEISDEIAMNTPFGNDGFLPSNFKEKQQRERYTKDIFSLMDKNCIKEMYYTHNPKDGTHAGFLIYGNRNTKTISLLFSKGQSDNEGQNYFYQTLKENCNVKVSINSGGNFVIKGKDSSNWKVVNSKYYHSFPYNLGYYKNKFSTNDTDPSSEELKQVYEDLLSRKTSIILCKNHVDFNSLVKKIKQQLADQFYSDVNTSVYVKQIDVNSKLRREDFLKTNNQKPWDVKLNITLKPNGEVIIKHVASDNYLKNYVDKWKKEAKARGLEINVEDLRKLIIADFESKAVENSFYQKFIQESKALLDDRIVGYVEGIQVTQKIGKNVWEEGVINQSTWHTKDKEHANWPKYAKINPLVGGVTDGAIDEIAGIPLALKGVYEIVTDEKKQESLMKIFTKDGASQMMEGLVKDAKETLNDQDKAQHFAGQTVVSVASMLSGAGFLTKAGKIDDAFDVANDISKPFNNHKTFDALENIKNINRYIPEENKAIEKIVKETDVEVLDELGDDLTKILRKGEDASVLKTARNLPGTALGSGKVIKGKWLKGKQGNAGLFPKSVAHKLKGKDFNNFDDFRKEFWKTVAEDPELSKQFRPQNIAKMKNGHAPSPIEEQWLGGQKTYVLHHKTPINSGGAVYDMDNLIILTPRFHKEVLAPSYHYGYGY